ncbi:MAG TPA: Na+/H+ antiporter [Gemmatimonadaceae bacterium]|jgi:CPA1 family monovalent cation:H+ antiporter
MTHFTPVVFAIAFAALVVALSALARRLPIPTPVLQLVAGLVVGFIPSLAVPDLDPDLVFFVFLPPIIWSAAMFTSPREFRRNFGSISLLAVGLVITTAVAIAVAARWLMPGIPWSVAVALGAIISPPDAVAATAIVSRMPVPRRVITVLEGESLVNDATALVLYRTAVAAAVVGTFSWGESLVRFFIDAGIGCLLGLFVGWLIIRAACWTRDPLAETLLTLAGPYVAWLSAESLHVSAVLACVAGGLYVQQKLSIAVGPASRLQIRTVWDLAIFLLNAMVFLLLGAQFGSLMTALKGEPIWIVARVGIVITIITVVVRLLWVPLLTFVRTMTKSYSRIGPPGWKATALVSWTSMRGVVSLATALALPRTLATGVPFPYRTQIILITMCVIVLTLVVQGLSLAPIVRLLGFEPERQHHEEEQLARREATRRGAEALEDLAREPWADQRDVEVLRSEVRDRARISDHHGGTPSGRRRLRLGMIAAERRMLIRLRNEGAISDEILRSLEQELDLESVRVGAGDRDDGIVLSS